MGRRLTVFVLISLLAFLMVFYGFYKEKSQNSEISTPIIEEYILKADNNVIRLYRGTKLIQIYDNVSVSSLPLTDQDNLRSGIRLKTMDEVTALIEDFDG